MPSFLDILECVDCLAIFGSTYILAKVGIQSCVKRHISPNLAIPGRM